MHRDTMRAKAAGTNYVLVLEPLNRCDAFLRLRFVLQQKLVFPHGIRVRSSVDEEGQGGPAMVRS